MKNATYQAKFARILLLPILLLIIQLAALAQGTTTQYVYDDSGRLAAVIAPSGETSVYQYDAAGNLTAISRQNTPVTIISGFNPNFGPVGTEVTIDGTGFNSSPSQNTVKFNGTPASIISSTPTQIVTSVPSGATTGRISVMSTNGAAVSRSDFTVKYPLAITSFLPNIGLSGTPVTINGQGFDADLPENNQIKFNDFEAASQLSISTTLTTYVPPIATSGHINITVGGDSVTSVEDFFVPPPGYTVSQVEKTGRLNINQSQQFRLSQIDRIALFVFNANAGEKIRLRLLEATQNGNLIIYSPQGNPIGAYETSTPSTFVEDVTAQTTGTYTVLIRFYGYGSGNLTAFPYISDIEQTLTIDGAKQTVNIAVVGQNAYLNFDAAENQTLALTVSDLSVGISDVIVYRPSGAILTSATALGNQVITLRLANLPETGNYQVWFNPRGTNIGNATFALRSITDLARTLTVDGAAEIIPLTIHGQAARLTFDYAQEHNLTLILTDVTVPQGSLNITGPSGQSIIYNLPIVTGSKTINLSGIAQTGTYTIDFVPRDGSVGAATFALITGGDIQGTISIGGDAVTIGTVAFGQNIRLRFNGTQGQRLFLRFTNSQFYGNITLLAPDGTPVVENVYIRQGGGKALDIQRLTSTGSYTIIIDPLSDGIGTITAIASETGSTSIGEYDLQVVFIAPNQTSIITFTGTSGDLVSLSTYPRSVENGTISIYSSNGILVTSSTFGNGIGCLTLPVTGNYRIEITPNANIIGNISIGLSSAGGGSGCGCGSGCTT